MPAPRKTLIFIPTYNEADNVRAMCEQILALGLDADVLFMDDASPDGTGAVLDELARALPRVAVIHRQGKLGIGSAHHKGIATAYDQDYQVLVTMDCDFTHAPADIPRLLAAAEDADLAIGSRFLERDSLPGWNWVRRSLTTLGHWVTRRALKIEGDATGAFRAYRLDRIPRAMFELVSATGYAFFFQSLFVAQQNGVRVQEVPIVLPARTYGHSKMSLREVLRSVEHIGSLYLASRLHPEQFRITGPIEGVDDRLVDPQGWEQYWRQKQRATARVYDLAATTYRRCVIKRNLERVLRREFASGLHLLHAGCGSGQADVALHDYAHISAVDISVEALRLYRRINPQAREVRHASVLSLPYPAGSFDGVFNMGVVEHFPEADIARMLAEFRRVLRRGGKVVLFWPHAWATSVFVLRAARWFLNDVLGRTVEFHPPEVSLLRSRHQAEGALKQAGFSLRSYEFSIRDLFIQAVIVAELL